MSQINAVDIIQQDINCFIELFIMELLINYSYIINYRFTENNQRWLLHV